MVETKIDEQAAVFRALHEGDPFVMPAPWDLGSVRICEAMGFRALETTTAGVAYSRARRETEVGLADVVDHLHTLGRATRAPISADVHNGFGPAPESAARAIKAAAAGGAVGASISDADARTGVYPLVLAADRVAAAADTAEALGHDFVLTARTDHHLHGQPDFDDTIARLQAFEHAGADVLCAPGLTSARDIRRVCAAVSRPVSVLATPGLAGADIVAAGAQRITVGSSLLWAAVEALVQAVQRMRDSGDFSALASPGQLDQWLVQLSS